jgi:hypothetical protein
MGIGGGCGPALLSPTLGLGLPPPTNRPVPSFISIDRPRAQNRSLNYNPGAGPGAGLSS